MYYHHDSSMEKRNVARLMNECTGLPPRLWQYTDSHCVSDTGIRAVLVFCRHSLDHYVERSIHQSCGPTEICYQFGPLLSRRAYCLTTTHFLEVEVASQQHPHGTILIEAPQLEKGRRTMAAEAILTDDTTTTSLQAQSMELRALVRQAHSNVPVLREAAHGNSICQNCFNVTLNPVPETANVLAASVTLKAGENGGILYLATVSLQRLVS